MTKKKDISVRSEVADVGIPSFEQVKDSIVTLRGCQVMLDCDVARLYGVETRAVNQAVKNNPDKFPNGYIYRIEKEEIANLRSKILIANSPMSRVLPTAFTEKGLYMLATILKCPRAVQATLCIIDTFSQLRELARTMQAVANTDSEQEKKTLMRRSGELIGNVIGAQLDTTSTETEIELNFAVVKIKHKVTRSKEKEK